MNVTVLVYCGSHLGGNSEFGVEVAALGKRIAEERMSLVYGGGGAGLMGILARAALEAGGQVTGVLPEFLEAQEVALTTVSKLIRVDSMHERKRIMIDLADAIVMAPGGYGTIEEFTEAAAYARLRLHTKPLFVMNVGGFFDALYEQLRLVSEHGFARGDFLESLRWHRCASSLVADLHGITAVREQ